MTLRTGILLPISLVMVVASSEMWADSGLFFRDEQPLSATFKLIDAKNSLFAVPNEREFILHVVYGGANEIAKIEVAPKHFFSEQHPEWGEPYDKTAMRFERYREILRLIERVQPLGELIHHSQAGYTTNLQTGITDHYRAAVVQRYEVRNYRRRVEDSEVASFSVFFFRRVSGEVQSKDQLTWPWGETEYRLKIDGKQYWTTKEVFQSLEPPKLARVRVAGPVF